MKKKLLITAALASVLLLSSCGGTQDAPMTEAQQAEKYGMSVAEFKEQKDAAARMNMTIDEHLNMPMGEGKMDHSGMDMGDDSSMIEDDSEASTTMPEGAHKMPDGTIMMADGSTLSDEKTHVMADGTVMDNKEAMSGESTHTMSDGTVMKDNDAHMDSKHKDGGVDSHSSDEHR